MMNRTKDSFKKRKDEVENYFYFLAILNDDENTRLKYKKDGNLVEDIIPAQFQKILIANSFLLLYNVIEATVRSSILEIYYAIKDNEINFEQLSENLKEIWIEQSTNNLKQGNFTSNTLHDCVLDIAESILTKETISFSENKLDFSGNLDAQKIRTIAKQYGFKMPSNGRNLETIKIKRNHLAHGDYTFSQIGKDFTEKEIKNFKDETFQFLEDVINKIEQFIIQERYTQT
ncbi:MAE_28990/MAE_18760 family HEPN-like nuclease [Thiotrichales bacterium HSG1]|nr:MAE_28990/MAE_18760 family HEPN-like nuclease [Thiotrichales bacterium HSG1]